MNKLTRISATVASSLSLVAGFAGVAGASPASIDTTGYSSSNTVRHTTDVRSQVNNDNRVSATNNNPQTARTGDVDSSRNTEAGGEAMSGAASNDGYLQASVTVDNSGAGSSVGGMGVASDNNGDASINRTGAESSNDIRSSYTVDTRVNNTNTVSITNNNSQNATSGDVSVDRNTEAGSARSGDASNVSTAVLDLNFTN